MRIDFITLFPEMCENFMNESIIGRARKNGYLQICFHQLRDYATDKHKKVDDCPFGGGKGMLLKPEPISNCINSLTNHLGKKPHIIYMSPKGSVLNQEKVKELSTRENICFLCGHYEGIDERIIEKYVDEQISVGDYVLTGGEMPAVVVCDAVCRMIDGVLSQEVCFTDESHFNGLLEHPQYTRPAVWEGMEVPKTLVSGDHKKVDAWKREKAIESTFIHRKDMIENALKEGYITQKELDNLKL